MIELLRNRGSEYLVLGEDKGRRIVALIVIEARGYGFKWEVGPKLAKRSTFAGAKSRQLRQFSGAKALICSTQSHAI